MSDDDRALRTTGRPFAGPMVALAGMLGSAGIVISAAGAHRGGGDLTATAGLFCLIHAAVVIGLMAWRQQIETPRDLFGFAAVLLLIGTILFAGDLVSAGLYDWRPLPMAAPIGGGAMMVGWLLVAVGGILIAVRRQ